MPGGPAIPQGRGGVQLPGQSTGGVGGFVGDTACALAGLPAGCTFAEVAAAAVARAFGQATGGGQTPTTCPDPTVYDPTLDTCILPGSPGEVSVTDVTDTQPDVSPGMFGFLSTSPIIVGQIRGRPIRRCPHPGLVLGKDNRCYPKGGEMGIPRKMRKWKPHKCQSKADKDLAAMKAAGAAAKRLKKKFSGTGYKVTKTGR